MSSTIARSAALVCLIALSINSVAAQEADAVEGHDHADEWAPIFTYQLSDICEPVPQPNDPNVIPIGRRGQAAAEPQQPGMIIPQECVWFILAVIDVAYLGGSSKPMDVGCLNQLYNRGGQEKWINATVDYLAANQSGTVPGVPAVFSVRNAIAEHQADDPECETP